MKISMIQDKNKFATHQKIEKEELNYKNNNQEKITKFLLIRIIKNCKMGYLLMKMILVRHRNII